MAKAVGPLFSVTASGRVGPLTYQNRQRASVPCRYYSPWCRGLPGLALPQATFQEAAQSWSQLSESERSAWNDLFGQNGRGFNAYVAATMNLLDSGEPVPLTPMPPQEPDPGTWALFTARKGFDPAITVNWAPQYQWTGLCILSTIDSTLNRSTIDQAKLRRRAQTTADASILQLSIPVVPRVTFASLRWIDLLSGQQVREDRARIYWPDV